MANPLFGTDNLDAEEIITDEAAETEAFTMQFFVDKKLELKPQEPTKQMTDKTVNERN